ncbi:MAG TPA: Hsp20/alpha crystallin family protein [Saprospiraceae bacterium]|mgnify:CR=1 FL=1|nr:Hsp20/alpha crystallin family protein [Saprospiraceae bacterium]
MRNLIKPYRAIPENSPVRLFDEFFKAGLNSLWGNDQFQDTPAINISQSETGYVLEVSAPGLKKEDFSIEVEADQLVLKAERKSEKETTTDQVIKKEFDYSSFKRSFHLDENLDRDSISAAYENGILRITIDKKEEQPKVLKTIDIK